MVLILRTFEDVLDAIRKAGGFLTGNLVLGDSRVVSLKANEIDPQIQLEIREERLPPLPASPRDLPTEELLRILDNAPGSLG